LQERLTISKLLGELLELIQKALKLVIWGEGAKGFDGSDGAVHDGARTFCVHVRPRQRERSWPIGVLLARLARNGLSKPSDARFDLMLLLEKGTQRVNRLNISVWRDSQLVQERQRPGVLGAQVGPFWGVQFESLEDSWQK
jgi:hypothetical protein